jgi:GT2 family glycosyltransferase
MNVEIICATRKSETDFRNNSALGISLLRLSYDKRLLVRIAPGNTTGLPVVYNEHLAAACGDNIVVFMHDDVWIDDYFFSQRIAEGLKTYDVIGVAGNRRRMPGQPSWLFIDGEFTRDEPGNLTGAVAHGPHPFGPVSYFGDAPAACELIDGVMLAAKKSVLIERNVFFDSRFEFHFYDMDFCRTARQNGLKLGIWPISLTHQSAGAVGSEQWRKSYGTYLGKWGA